jgi:hypothetical protein
MNNNDIFKKLRVALMLRDDQIVEILELVDFRMSKGELGNIFRNEDHPNFMECGDQVLRNFLNGLVIHLRGTKEDPKIPSEVIAKHKKEEPITAYSKTSASQKHKKEEPIIAYSKSKNVKSNKVALDHKKEEPITDYSRSALALDHKKEEPITDYSKIKPNTTKKKPSSNAKSREKKKEPKVQVVEKVKFKNGKK